MIVAEIPDELAQAFHQHVRDFDRAHPGCHFKIANASPDDDVSIADMMEAIKVDPPLDFQRVQRRSERRRQALAVVADNLAWRSPSGKAQNFVCLPRDMAEALIEAPL
jgi:hypothetical protein